MNVLGIETSCDETGVALYGEAGLIAHRVYSQLETHAAYGGVVPELASRDHVRKLLPLVQEVMADASFKASDIDGIAYTGGPGLIGALLVGACFGRSLAFAWDIPSIAIHHMEGHLLAPMMEVNPPEFPFLALLVSGGHTQLVTVNGIGEYQLLGETLDDAVGEAFDKTAKLLGLPYPGGAALAELAEEGSTKRFIFPRPMTDRPGLDFSFSGLKTHVRNTWEHSEQDEQCKADIARAFQTAVVDTLVIKTKRAVKATGFERVVVAGGVSANQHLRVALYQLSKKENFTVYFPRHEFCADNGAMIAYAGYQRLSAGQQDDLAIKVQARWPIVELSKI